MRLITSVLLIPFFLILITVSGFQALAQDEDNQEPLKVVTKAIEPFVFVVNGEVNGFSIDLWEALAYDTGLQFEYEIVTTVQEQLDAVEHNKADVAIAAITITEKREESVDFSHSYFESGLGILTHRRGETRFSDILRVLSSPPILRILAGLIINVIVGAHVIWLIERRRNPEFPRSYPKGVWEGIWWSAVTITTVGYGDKIPISRLGRVVAMFWMFAGLFIIANFTAGVTTELTFQRLHGTINGPEDLPGKHIVTVEGSTANAWLTDRRIKHSTVETVDDAYALLDNRIAQAVVYDYPVLLFRALQHPDRGYIVPGDAFNTEVYGIALPQGSPLREEINRSLLRLKEGGVYDEIYAKWYGLVFD